MKLYIFQVQIVLNSFCKVCKKYYSKKMSEQHSTEEQDSNVTQCRTIVLLDSLNHSLHHDPALLSLMRQFMIKTCRERTLRIRTRFMILHQIKHSEVPFIPSLRPNFDFTLDRDVVLAAVRKHGGKALILAHSQFKNDREMVKEAALKDGRIDSVYVGHN